MRQFVHSQRVRKPRSVNFANVSDVLRPYGHSLVAIFEYYCLYGEVTPLLYVSPLRLRAAPKRTLLFAG